MSFRVFARRAIAATACAGVGAAAYPFVSAPFPRALQESNALVERERLVVLGSGWGAVALLKNIDPTLYDVSVVSPRNFFLNTPLLPGVTVGTVEARSLIEPVRALLLRRDAAHGSVRAHAQGGARERGAGRGAAQWLKSTSAECTHGG